MIKRLTLTKGQIAIMKRIAVIPNVTKDDNFLNTRRIIDFLHGKAEIYADEKYAEQELPVNYVPYKELFENADYMIALGGDGTMLQIASQCAEKDIPVLGINLGKVGFLTEIELENIEAALTKLVEGDFHIEKRMLVRADIKKENGEHIHCHALNDIVTAKNAGTKLINLELYTDGELVNNYIADGIIIATPTGSTGYSISAGGPVADPSMELYIATPICPHMLSVRSAVLSSEKEIVIKLNEKYLNNSAVITADGDVQCEITPSDEVRITKSKYRFSIIKIGNSSFYDTLLKKLS